MRSLRVITLVASVLAFAGLAETAGAATPPPFVRSGTLAIGAGTATQRVKVTFSGTIPNLKKGEYVAYFATSIDGPSGPEQCNLFGFDVGAGPTKPRRKKTTLDPSYGMEWPINEEPRWCTGKWIVQAFVYKPVKNAYKPRLVFARKIFSIG